MTLWLALVSASLVRRRILEMEETSLDEEVEKATSFMAQNLMLSEKFDEDGEPEGTLYLAGKVL